MCGIAGFFRIQEGRPTPSPETLAAMGRALRHRGPDASGEFHDAQRGVGLAHRRLSIIDLKGGDQPISGSDGRSRIILNGEIYNYRELRRELSGLGCRFHTASDTEVLLRAYETWGLDGLARLNGMFAFALWDDGEKRLILARDPAGIKPLYFEERDGHLWFASEIHGLLEVRDRSPEMDSAALGLYLAFRYVPSPATLIAGVRRLPPGNVLIADGKGVRMFRYPAPAEPTPPARNQRGALSQKAAVARFSELLREAIQRQTVSDVPIGVLLSGGLDSAVVAYHAQAALAEPLRTFTIGFDDEGDASELPEARDTARRLGTRHTEIEVSAGDFREDLPRVLAQVEEPISSSSALALYTVCREARRHVKVVLTGQGADEPLGGYDRYRAEAHSAWMRRIPAGIRQRLLIPGARWLRAGEKPRRALAALGEADPLRRFLRIYDVFPAGFTRRLVRREHQEAIFAEDPLDLLRAWDVPTGVVSPVARMMWIDTRMWLPDDLLLYGDKMSMASGLELRVPFLDLRLLEFVESLPPELRIRGLAGKYILKQAAETWFDRDFVRRPKKGFAPPLAMWFRGTLRDYVRDTLLAEDAVTRTWFEPAPLAALLDEHAEGRADHHRAIYTLLSLELWARCFLGGGRDRVSRLSADPPPAVPVGGAA